MLPMLILALALMAACGAAGNAQQAAALSRPARPGCRRTDGSACQEPAAAEPTEAPAEEPAAEATRAPPKSLPPEKPCGGHQLRHRRRSHHHLHRRPGKHPTPTPKRPPSNASGLSAPTSPWTASPVTPMCRTCWPST
ncbi:MAG: hypothetical protein R2856_11420 [Caldilineaceae bacterium]